MSVIVIFLHCSVLLGTSSSIIRTRVILKLNTSRRDRISQPLDVCVIILCVLLVRFIIVVIIRLKEQKNETIIARPDRYLTCKYHKSHFHLLLLFSSTKPTIGSRASITVCCACMLSGDKEMLVRKFIVSIYVVLKL